MSLSINKIKHIRSLRMKKFRQKYGQFLVEGDKMAKELMKQRKIKILEIYALASWVNECKPLLDNSSFDLETVTEKELSRISALSTPNQVVILCEQPTNSSNNSYNGSGIALFLDNIQNPGNMGTIIRTALWFGISHIFCSPNCVEEYNQKVIQSTMGAFFMMSFQRMDIKEINHQWPNVPIMATTMDGDNLYEVSKPPNAILVIGNESQGVSPAIQEMADQLITIPAAKESKVESLNAAIAAGICMAHLTQNEVQIK